MSKLIQILVALLMGIVMSSCSSNIQTGTAKYYDTMDVEHCQAVLNLLPLHQTVFASFDPKAPQRLVTDPLWTDPCEDMPIPYTYVSGAVEKERVNTLIENICSRLPGPWVATFVTYNGEPMPSLIRPGTTPSSYLPLNIYLDEKYSEPIRVLVATD